MSWWVVVAAAIVVVVVAWVATNWLLGEAASAKDPGAARVDAIKTGLGIGAGTTGIFALLLAVRRQWHSESDATEKNVTELYTKAADQLGSAEAPVRLAGLYALERLAHNNPGQRQSIVNVICAYLRMPFTPPNPAPATDDPEQQERTQEREVRLAGQRILQDHVDPQNRGKFWADIDLDLTNAHLIDFGLSGRRLRRVRFNGATFNGPASFDDATFTGPAVFSEAIFTDLAAFVDATFAGSASFLEATFTGEGMVPQRNLHRRRVVRRRDFHRRGMVLRRDLHQQCSIRRGDFHRPSLIRGSDLHRPRLVHRRDLHQQGLVRQRDLHRQGPIRPGDLRRWSP
ncbi:pentapeptide repeat-containing protein [Amycolatopsis sp. OK19-0408]|uniref:Pentapeptide repeat-containing protein n=1 Tax=Amycolatopsis iheyensis TaxID=2945988 RepID=A0A9X2SMP9_9PSEU|nr:pentapeptide repeat-containing protein [Amycolatopsis iheyensis]MCR6486161.1 pentapeptide repeat-containing protein [Amycolatopsis iheyensis]